MTNPPRTVTLPEGEQPPVLEGPDLITAVREFGGTAQFPLITNKGTYTIGSSPGCDIVIASQFVSSLHCLLERRGQRIRVHDQTSRNGTFLRGRRETTFDIGPGDTFTVASSTLLALNDDMQLVRPVLAHVLGYDLDPRVDELLIASIEDEPLLIVGPNGAGHSRLVRAIHQASRRRRRALVEVAALPATREEQKRLVTSAHRGTLALSAGDAAIDEAFLDMALSPTFRVRLVILAPSVTSVLESLRPDAFTRMDRIEIRPIRERRAEIGRLIDHLLLENRVSLRSTDLTTDNQRALRAYLWPENLDELTEAVAQIVEIVREGSIRKAASTLDVPRTSLQYWMERLGLKLPLTRTGFTLDGGSRRRNSTRDGH